MWGAAARGSTATRPAEAVGRCSASQASAFSTSQPAAMSKATAAVKDQVKRGSRAVLGINAILRPTLKRNPDLKAAWKNAKTKKGPVGGGSTAAGATLAPAALVAPVAQQDASAATTPKAA